jgi:hypothetical protein
VIIKNVAAWFSTDEAVDWMRIRLGESELLLTRVDGRGISLRSERGASIHEYGVQSADLVRLGRYILAVAAAQGQNINEGFIGVSEL